MASRELHFERLRKIIGIFCNCKFSLGMEGGGSAPTVGEGPGHSQPAKAQRVRGPRRPVDMHKVEMAIRIAMPDLDNIDIRVVAGDSGCGPSMVVFFCPCKSYDLAGGAQGAPVAVRQLDDLKSHFETKKHVGCKYACGLLEGSERARVGCAVWPVIIRGACFALLLRRHCPRCRPCRRSRAS